MRNEDVVTLFDAYSNDLYRFALMYLGSIQDAEDIVQEVFLKLLDKHMFFERKNEKAYLLTMTANRCKDQLRSSSRNEIVDLESVEWQLADNERFTERHRAVFDELMRLEDDYHYGQGQVNCSDGASIENGASDNPEPLIFFGGYSWYNIKISKQNLIIKGRSV